MTGEKVISIPTHWAVTGIPSWVRTLYRSLRVAGMSRRDANLITAGVVMGSGEGTVGVKPGEGRHA